LIDLPAGPFGVVLADPPWAFKVRSPKGEGRSPKYRTMNLAAIQAMRVQDVAADDCHLFLWATGPCLPQALDTMAAWGFRYSGMGFTWAKLRRAYDADQLRFTPSIASAFFVGLGYTTRKNCEFCLLGRRGNPKRLSASVRELILAPVREHSRKPDEVYRRIEAYCAGPRLDLFSRERRDGWVGWGDESELFG
jgi:N6-adenosine-specific RNA methylase IME4